MKRLNINISEEYKSYKRDTNYSLEGDLIILSGINGTGKSQLLNIIANNSNERIVRNVQQYDDGKLELIENILFLSFRDNINLGQSFGNYSVTYKTEYAKRAWEFYRDNIKHGKNNYQNDKKRQNFEDGTLIFYDNGTRNPSWRSINKLVYLLKKYYSDDTVFQLSQNEVEKILPADFVWRDENDIIELVGNLFYIACCDRANKQIECSKSTEVFNNIEWLKNAPWTILNKLFKELNFKYKFKDDYEFITPNMEEKPQLRDDLEIRGLMDLSDGEKAILKLALISLDEEISNDIKLVLFDEYDAPLNPSLTEAFFHVIDEFYIKKGIQVILTTHSPATISLAPEYTKFYEIFARINASPKIVEVDQLEYSELRIANKLFYDKLKNQEERIRELEHDLAEDGNMLFVEDRYDQIYKIAYLKVHGIEGITENNYEELFEQHSAFSIHGNFSCGGLYSRLISSNTSSDKNNVIICLFDFDFEGYSKYKELKEKKDNQIKLFPNQYGTLRDGLYIKHHNSERYALMLPIPERLENYVSTKSSTDCFIEIESLLSSEYLETNEKAELRSQVLLFYKMKDKHKKDFWKDLIDVKKEYFEDFKPLFEQINHIFQEARNNN